jgi:DNA-binding response OmpR family regulator
VVDDDVAIRKLFIKKLRLEGYDVRDAPDGKRRFHPLGRTNATC